MGWPLSLRSSLHLVIKMAMREVEAEEKTPKNPFFRVAISDPDQEMGILIQSILKCPSLWILLL